MDEKSDAFVRAVLAPSWIDTPMVQGFKQLGAVKDEDCVPMQTITDAFIRFVEDTTLTGKLGSTADDFRPQQSKPCLHFIVILQGL